MDGGGTLQDRAREPLIVDQVFERGAHFRLGEMLVLLIEPEIVDGAFGHLADGDVGAVAKCFDLIGLEIARDVDVALLQQQHLGRRFGDVLGHNALETGRTAPIVRVGVDD